MALQRDEVVAALVQDRCGDVGLVPSPPWAQGRPGWPTRASVLEAP
jgi:hypothetical protein